MSIKVDPRGSVQLSTKVDNKVQSAAMSRMCRSTIVDRLTEMTYCYFYHIFSTGGKVIKFISASKKLIYKTSGEIF